jgi:lysine 2,3-aminomutase
MWKQELAQSYDSVHSLSEAGFLAPSEADRLRSLGERYKVRVTPYYAGLITREDPSCPIRLQAIPGLGEEDPELPTWAREMSQAIYGRPVPWHTDAIGDLERLAAPRLTHRYGNRAILHLSSLCAVYCRFCFRKGHLNDEDRTLYDGSLDAAFEYLKGATEIRELILTGGDPLSLTDAALERVLDRLAAELPHLRVVRIHSRMAVTLPSRLDSGLAETLGRDRPYRTHLVSHFNHPREWTLEARQGLDRMRRAGIALYNQNVLLAGINDSIECLAALYQGLYDEGVTPFYLHQADWTPGTFSFRVSIERGREIVRGLRGRLPGAAIPHYVLDIPQGYGKVHLMDQEAVRLVRRWDSSTIAGALYELTAPHTRSGLSAPRYLDLFPVPIR